MKKGITFIDVLVGTALVMVVFLGIFGAFQLGLKVVQQSQNKVAAAAIANQWIEKIRNLPYGSVGIIGASLPYAEGVLESSTTTVLNNIEYVVATQVKYISDSADGIGVADSCDLDYKRAEVKVSWLGKFNGEVKLVADIAPKNKVQELTSCEAQPGGVLSISVFDAFGQMIESPLIEIFDPTTEALIDSYTPFSGKQDFPLATSSYKVVVSKSNYSTDRTYGTDEIATPEKPHPMVLEGELTEVSFSIDEVSSFSVDTLSPWGKDFFSDTFDNTAKISESSDLIVDSGEISLATDTEGYLASGHLFSISVVPSSLLYWDELSWSDSEPIGTDVKYHIYYASGTDWYLVPEIDLFGNAVGFDVSPVNLSNLSFAAYSQLKIKGDFSTVAAISTPLLYDWQISWLTNEATPIQNMTFLLQGAKLIGTDGDEEPVYKYSASSTSDSAGQVEITNLEWDSYTFSLGPGSSLDLVETDPSPQPISLVPETSALVDLYLRADNSLLLTLQDVETLAPVFSATTTLSNFILSYEKTQYTNEKGQTYFIPLENVYYDLAIEGPGYFSTSTSIFISGDITRTIRLEREE
ncbi:MAG: hypothetical protein ABIG08_01520 [bacterium]